MNLQAEDRSLVERFEVQTRYVTTPPVMTRADGRQLRAVASSAIRSISMAPLQAITVDLFPCLTHILNDHELGLVLDNALGRRIFVSRISTNR